jgi:UDP-2,4-diacetamido-2,4,6-trideoxy-beta-L-altropyranose hydrolase
MQMGDFPPRRLVFRADGNATIGLGHLMRLLALADLLRGLAPGIFVVREPTPAVAQLITDAGWAVQSLPAGQTLLAEADWLAESFLQASDVLLLDGYAYEAAYQQRLRQRGCGLVYIDDLRAWPVVADVLINHSPGVTPTDYQAPATTRLLLGPAYSLLRQPFLKAAAPPHASGDSPSILVCFGGADPLRLTARTLEALLTLPQVQRIGLLVGAAFDGDEALQQLTLQYPERAITVYRNLGAAELVTLLQAYGVAVVPASTVLIEALVLGRPALTGYYADNQQALASYVHAHHQAFSIGNFADLTGGKLATALWQGLRHLATHAPQPYVAQLHPEHLRAEIARLLTH